MASVEPTASDPALGGETPLGRRSPGRARRLALGALGAALLVALGAATALLRARTPLRPAAPSVPVALAAVTQGPLTSQQQEIGTVEDTKSYQVIDQAQGVITALPALGQVVRQGGSLYAVDNVPVVLLYGGTPAYRSLSLGMTGPDVAELNADLVALGEATRAALPRGDDAFSPATAAALARFQARAGLPATGSLPLGQAVFLPEAIEVAGVTPSLGASAVPGQQVLQATSTRLEVVVQLDASQESQVHAGNPAAITLPDGNNTPGRVSYVADVATAASSSGTSSGPTVQVDVVPERRAALRSLGNAQLDVEITTASVRNALAVPVTALLAQADGGYAVEVAGKGGTQRLLPVRLGIFDDAAGLVQVSGPGLRAGQEVVVAGT